MENWNTTEKAIYKAWIGGKFAKLGMRQTCLVIADKLGSSPSTIRSTYARMKRYGAFPKEKKKYIQVSFRMDESLHLQLKQKSFKTGKSLNKLITQGVKRIV